jgi:hypothetical protein
MSMNPQELALAIGNAIRSGAEKPSVPERVLREAD